MQHALAATAVLDIPLRNRTGEVVAYAQIDVADAHLAEFRWCRNGKGYAKRAVRLDGRQRWVLLHREVLGLAAGDPRDGDHINGDTLDNRRGNLRVLPRGANAQNRRSVRASSSRYRGVSWNKQRQHWVAYCYTGGKQIHLGCFDSEEEAARTAAFQRSLHMPYSVEGAVA